MTIHFLHTADWQLGKPFASVADASKRHRLQQQRIGAIGRIGEVVRESGCAFVVIAGDLFDSPQATKSTVSAACGAIGLLKVPVLVIPGNHDHGGPGSIWEQEFFVRERQQLAPNLRVLLTPEPVVLESAVVFPAPLLRRHEPGDPTAWIRSALLEAAFPRDLPRIVLAHGTVQGFGTVEEDEDAGMTAVSNWIDLARLPMDELDYIALGDWHGTKQVGPKAWYSGTPEIDRFPKGGGNDPGNLLKVSVVRGEPPVVEKMPSSQFQWKEMSFRFSGDDTVGPFLSQLEEVTGAVGDTLLLSLVLEGSLGMEASNQLEKILESWDSRLLRLRLRNLVTVAPSESELAGLTQRAEDPLISSVARQLVPQTAGDDGDAVIARLALRELHAALE